MKKVILTVAVVTALVWVLSGTGFCQDDDEERMEKRPRWEEDDRDDRHQGREGGKRWKEMRNQRNGGENDRMGGERHERMGRFLELLKDKDPEKYEDLMRLREENPDLFREKLREHVGEFIKNKRGKGREKMDPETRERMKEIRGLEKQSRELAEQHRGADTDEEKQTIAEDLKSVLVKSFDLKLVNQRKEVERVESELKKFKESLKKREESRRKIIQKRFEELTGKTSHLKW